MMFIGSKRNEGVVVPGVPKMVPSTHLSTGESTKQEPNTQGDCKRRNRIAPHSCLSLFSYVQRLVLRASDLRVCSAGDCGTQPFEVGTDGLELISPLLAALI